MKTCPDCAESVQDAARKCRFCGFRFDAPAADATTPAADARDDSTDAERESEVVGPERASKKSALPYALVAAGGGCVALGGLAMCYLLATGRVDPWITVGSFSIGGVLMACGWAALLARGEAGFGAVLGSLLLSACWIFGASLDVGGGPIEQLAKGMLGTAGLLVCAFLHLGTLDKQDLDGARLAAMVACVGFGVQLFALSKRIELSDSVQSALMWAGMLGTLIFGIALVVGACARWSDSRHG